MAIVTSLLSAGKLSAYNASKPLLLARNVLAGQPTYDVTDGIGPETAISAVWRTSISLGWSANKIPVALDNRGETDLGQCPLRAFDQSLVGLTAPWESTSSYYPGAAFIAKADAAYAVDSVVIANHNFKELSDHITAEGFGPLILEVWAHTDNTFGGPGSGTTGTKLVRWEPGVTPGFSAWTTERLVCLDLGGSPGSAGFPAGFAGKFNSFTNIAYIEIVIVNNHNSATKLHAPMLGEVFIGPRHQLSRTPMYNSWDDEQIENIVGEFTTKSGVKTRYGLSTGRSMYSPNWNPIGDATLGVSDLYGLNDFETLESFWQATNYGANTFFLIPDPKNSPRISPMCRVVSADFPAELVSGLTEHEVEFEFEELSPYVREET